MNIPEWITYSELPHHAGGFSALFCDYIEAFRNVQQFFEFDYRALDELPHYAEKLMARSLDRSILADVLTEQNKAFGAAAQTLQNIERLRDPKTFAVVTGQQVGVLGGPLYTLYKAVTAIKLARKLTADYPPFTFVPVFWLEGEDHDFEEMNHAGFLTQDYLPAKVEYLIDGKPLTHNVGAVGEIAFTGMLDGFFDSLGKTLTNSEFKQPLLELLRTSYRAGATFNQAFASLMNSLLEGQGLVFISSNDPRLKKLLSPVFRKEIQEYPRVSQLVIQQSALLEENYHAQIKTKALNLFLFHKGGRYIIEPRENDFSLKGTRHFIPRDELLRIASEEPHLLSPNVALRPICQDTLLPTIVYVAGPSEIAYFAQMRSVYHNFNLFMPVIYPRASATIVEDKMLRILEKYGVGLEEAFGESAALNKRVVETVSEVKIDEMFGETIRRINDSLNEMKFGINYVDSTLLGSLENTRTKVDAAMQILRQKVNEAQARRHEVALRQIGKVTNTLFPNKNFQERELSVVYFLNRHGMELLRFLDAELASDLFKHQIITL